MLTLAFAIVFTLGAIASAFSRKRRTWWVLTLFLAVAAIVNWLRWFEVM